MISAKRRTFIPYLFVWFYPENRVRKLSIDPSLSLSLSLSRRCVGMRRLVRHCKHNLPIKFTCRICSSNEPVKFNISLLKSHEKKSRNRENMKHEYSGISHVFKTKISQAINPDYIFLQSVASISNKMQLLGASFSCDN